MLIILLMSKIRYYISGHGLGHASRSCQIINILRQRHPQIAVDVVSNAHAWFLRGFLDPSVPVRHAVLDLGVLQQDSLRMREEETLQAYRAFLPERKRLVDAESTALQRDGVSLAVADIPPPAFAAAALAGIPGVAVSNFTWDWIYRDLARRHPGYDDVLDSVAADYQQATLLLRLPFHGEFPNIERSEDLPLVARRARLDPFAVRTLLQIPPGKRVGLISFGGFGLEDFDFAPLAQLRDWVFLTEKGLEGQAPNLLTVPAGKILYPDLVRAADAVITKPGYGIVSEAIANHTAVLYTSRGAFPEQELLVAGLERYARARRIGNDRLRSGDWGEDLAALLAQPAPSQKIAINGDEVAADRLAELAAP